MTQAEKLDRIISEHNGIVRLLQAVDEGISKQAFYEYVRKNKMDQVCHGIYATKDSWPDTLYCLHLRCPDAVFSHSTALYFHDLTDREPLKYSITLKTGCNPSHLTKDGIKVYTVKKELYDIGLIQKETNFGNPVFVYDMERTICDVVRSRKNIDVQVFTDALKQYARKQNKNLHTLMEYAELFHIDKILRQYMEVLL